MGILIRNSHLYDVPAIANLSSRHGAFLPVRTEEQVMAELRSFPEGQFVAVDRSSGRILGFAASQIIRWEELRTGGDQVRLGRPQAGARGETLLGTGILVEPGCRRLGIGTELDLCRKHLVRRLNLSRMRGLIWLVGYPRYEGMLSVDEYADEVLRGRIREPSLSFRLERGFKVVGTIDGHWAVLDWPNPRELEFTRGLS